jgi:ribonuclease E
MKKEMLINVLQPEECRIAILEDGVLEELYVERTSHESYVGNIYKGRIVNIEPSIQAAFVDFGVGRNGFLHVSDVEPAYYRHLEGNRFEERGRERGRGRDRGRGRERDRGPRSEWRERRGPAASTEALIEEDLDRIEEEARLKASDATEEAAATQEASPPAIEEAIPQVVESVQMQDEPEPARERRRSRGGSRRRREEPDEQPPHEPEDHTEAASEENAPNAEPAEEPKPRLMDSAERRTEEGDAGAQVEEQATAAESTSPIRDEDLFFPREEASKPHHEPPLVESPVAEPDEPLSYEQEPEPEPEPEREAPPREEPQPLPEVRDHAEDERYAEELADERLPDFDDDLESAPRRSRGRGERDDLNGRRGRRPSGRRMGGRPGMGRPKPLIQDIFRRGQEVLVQVIKEGIGTKGPTLSTYISIAGRYLVLMPGLNRVGVSRKIADDEQRRRLREIFHELKPPKGLGFIIRTAGMDKNKKELQRDLAYLSRLWQVVVRRIRKVKAPAEIYQESDMITRTIRDTFTSDIDTIWVDEPDAFAHAQEFLQIVMPRYANRIKHYDGPEPLFHKYGIEDEIARIQQRHVPLPHGGSIVIDQTEALVAIDVNSGNFRADNNAEETAYQMNLHAAKEIARQLRLRDLGGVIVNDFIDMREEKHRRGVERAMREAVKRDRARTKVLKISQFGIIEMTRQRIRPSLKRSVYQDCPHCLGSGQVKTCESMSIDVMRMIQLAAHKNGVYRIQIRVAEDVASYLLNKKRKEITRLEESGGIQIHISGMPGVAPETLEFLCLDNNNNEIKVMPFDEERTRRR